MLKVREFRNANDLNDFVKMNIKYIKNNYSIEIYKYQRSYFKEVDFPTERFIIPYEEIVYILKYETVGTEDNV